MPLSFGPDPRLEYSRCCRGLIALNVAVFLSAAVAPLLGMGGGWGERLFGGGALIPSVLMGEAEWWRLFSYQFLHAHALHLGVNMMGIYLLGPDLERALGAGKFLWLYFASGVAGGLGFVAITYLLRGQAHFSVGASGAVFGLLGGIVALYPRRVYVVLPIFLPLRAAVLAVLLFTGHLFFILTPYGNAVAYDVHLAGGLTGFALAAGFAERHRRRWRGRFPRVEVAYACVELESLVHRVAEQGESALSSEEQTRYQELREALRFEDLPSVEELRANAP